MISPEDPIARQHAKHYDISHREEWERFNRERVQNLFVAWEQLSLDQLLIEARNTFYPGQTISPFHIQIGTNKKEDPDVLIRQKEDGSGWITWCTLCQDHFDSTDRVGLMKTSALNPKDVIDVLFLRKYIGPANEPGKRLFEMAHMETNIAWGPTDGELLMIRLDEFGKPKDDPVTFTTKMRADLKAAFGNK